MARTAKGGGRAPFSSATTTKKSKPTRANRSSKSDPANAYTYEPSLPKRHRTSEQQNSLTYEETKAGPSSPRRKNRDIEEEDEGDEELEMEERIRKLQRMIAGDAPAEIDEESEESEVDSDEAWGSEGSDEERWGDVFRDLQKGKSKKGKSKGKEVVLKVSRDAAFSGRVTLIYSPLN
jgi:U3 small nucleolar RNA-associated protein 14